MIRIDPSASITLASSIVCGPYVGILIRERQTTVSILTSRDLVDVPSNAPMRPVIQSDLAQQVMNALCREGDGNSEMPVWADVWENRDVLIAELAASLAKSERAVRAALRRKDPMVSLPDLPRFAAGYEAMGAFRVEQGLIIADRCYVNRDHPLLATRTPALAGNWYAYIRNDPHFDGRSVSLLVVHEAHLDAGKQAGEDAGIFGVDAGCAVIVDQRVLDDEALVHELAESSDWDEGIIRDIGCFSHTYDGDGVYRVRVIKHGDDVVAVRANLSRDETYDYHVAPPPESYQKSLDQALEAAGPAKPYSIYEKFSVGDRVSHKKFGEGLVTKIVDVGKVEISFLEGVKILVCNQKK